METKYNDPENRYLLLDGRNIPLAHVILEGSPESQILTAKLTDKETASVLTHEIYRLLGIKKNQPPIQCQLIRQNDKQIVLERISVLDPELRKDLRVPLHRKSFLYFPKGESFGKDEIEFMDISCGGMAFYGSTGLETVENLEVVLPITVNPLIVKCQILNSRKLRDDKALYTAKFLNLCNDEEKMIREAVFSLQLEGRSRHSQI